MRRSHMQSIRCYCKNEAVDFHALCGMTGSDRCETFREQFMVMDIMERSYQAFRHNACYSLDGLGC